MLKIDVKPNSLKFGETSYIVQILGTENNGYEHTIPIGEIVETNTRYWDVIAYNPRRRIDTVYKKDKAVKMLVSEFEKKVS